MAILGCMNPAAANYDPAATQDDGTCVYLSKVGGVCYSFEDAPEDEEKSFTLSLAMSGDNWVFYHAYLPDFYFSTRKQMYNLKNGKIFKANKGAPGKYHDQSITAPFFIDVVMKNEGNEILNTLNWITELFTPGGVPVEFATFTHITVWNSYQCTGRIDLAQNFQDLQYEDMRLTGGAWTFNNMRDIIIQRGTTFLTDLFHNIRPIDSQLDKSQPWYNLLLMEDKYFVVRFEFDNLDGNKLFFHGAGKNTTLQIR